MDKIRTRFAPSPTGFMHIGNLRTALYSYLFAKKNGGSFILRIEDTDKERYVEGAEDVIYRTLKTSGIKTDEGPREGGAFAPYVQSERQSIGIYKKYAEELIRRGGAYYCFCTKERLEGLTDKNGVRTYDKHCLKLTKEEVEANLKKGMPYVIRQNIPKDTATVYNDLVFGEISVDSNDLEDNILIKSDGMPTYNFANVVDDRLMGITHVLRGVEYLSSTPKYNLMYDAFGWERPTYIHLQLIMKDAARKLSKRYGDANFEDFIKKGYLPHAIINYIALLGWSPKDNVEKMTMEELISNFSVEGLSRSCSIFDENKMRWLNSLYIKEMPPEEFAAAAESFIKESKANGFCHKKIAKLLHTRTEILSDIPGLIDFIAEFYDAGFDTSLFVNQKWKTDGALAKRILESYLDEIAPAEFTEEGLNGFFAALAEKNGLKKGQVLWCVRIAVTGRAATPGGATEMLDLLGFAESGKRIRYAIEKLGAS
ncbi:MAG: glutamate--tRNA ligase [Clostridiales bacterium]|jgi:glutamyl-tRNA synthetase|nr:glutamate--tRNA ligase [Clostridiales bacterium]